MDKLSLLNCLGLDFKLIVNKVQNIMWIEYNPSLCDLKSLLMIWNLNIIVICKFHMFCAWCSFLPFCVKMLDLNYCFLCKWVIILVLTWCINPNIFMLWFMCVMMVIVVNVNKGMHYMFVLHFLFFNLCKWGWTLLHFFYYVGVAPITVVLFEHFIHTHTHIVVYVCVLLCFLV